MYVSDVRHLTVWFENEETDVLWSRCVYQEGMRASILFNNQWDV